jgi:hypothetical protein
VDLNVLFVTASRLEWDEAILAVFTVTPLLCALVALMRWVTGRRYVPSDDLLSKTESTMALVTNLQRSLESAKASFDSRLERGEGARQETHFNDLHKDLAGIVWELSKLRAEIARVQSQSAQGCASAGARSSEPSADRPLNAGAGGARVYSGGR